MPIITLTTDFGYRDGYVGAMKGVVARLAPAATVIDIAHDIPRGDIAHAAWVVKTSTLEFPPGTIHVVVVDPGVGGERQAVIAHVDRPAGMQIYVAPDNGVLAYVHPLRAWHIDVARLGPISSTFHGRDVFAPAAAHLATHDLAIYGASTNLEKGRLTWEPEGCIVHIDQYGNLISDLAPVAAVQAIAINGRLIPLVRTYEDVASGELLAYVGSAGTLEVAVRDGRADTVLGVARGTPITYAQEGPYR